MPFMKLRGEGVDSFQRQREVCWVDEHATTSISFFIVHSLFPSTFSYPSSFGRKCHNTLPPGNEGWLQVDSFYLYLTLWFPVIWLCKLILFAMLFFQQQWNTKITINLCVLTPLPPCTKLHTTPQCAVPSGFELAMPKEFGTFLTCSIVAF